MINTYDLFITRVSQGKIPIPINIHKRIISFIEKNYTEEDIISCVKGFQLHEDFDGKKELNTILDNYFSTTFHLSIQHGWLNVLGKNSYNKPHSHNGDNISHSGVFYLSSQNNNITLSKNGEVFEIQPKLFDYLIFPHNLLHYVLPENRIEKRICYSFNLQKHEGDK
jgi:hypothetical protein